jgi:hypothetical protein
VVHICIICIYQFPHDCFLQFPNFRQFMDFLQNSQLKTVVMNFPSCVLWCMGSEWWLPRALPSSVNSHVTILLRLILSYGFQKPSIENTFPNSSYSCKYTECKVITTEIKLKNIRETRLAAPSCTWMYSIKGRTHGNVFEWFYGCMVVILKLI